MLLNIEIIFKDFSAQNASLVPSTAGRLSPAGAVAHLPTLAEKTKKQVPWRWKLYIDRWDDTL